MLENHLNHPKMNQEFFKSVPSEIVIDILSRLPVRSVISCKCVHKSWLHLVESREFVKLHLSRSVPDLTVCEVDSRSRLCKFFEFNDGLDVEHHDLHYKLVTKFSLTNQLGSIWGSVDGLLLLCNLDGKPDAPSICNPITREYINLNCPQEFVDNKDVVFTWGFGSSKMSSKYKVVRISHDFVRSLETRKLQKTFKVECHVYTLGTGLWRRHAYCVLMYMYLNTGVFANGSLHWLVCDLDNCLRVSCFDLETERFNTFSAPPLHGLFELTLFTLGDCLGVCGCTSLGQIVIWLMKEYGVEKSWTKEFVVSESRGFAINVYPIKVFKDGDILILRKGLLLVYYSSKTKTTETVNILKRQNPKYHIEATLHTPSFLSLKGFGLDVSAF